MALIKLNTRSIPDDTVTPAKVSQNLGRRNLIINGDFQVAQRATSVTSQTASGYKTVDRLYTNASGATYSQSQQTVTVGGETGLPLQFSKFLRHQVTTGNNWSQVYQKIENVSSVPAGTVTLSFYAKGTSPDAGLSFIAWQNFGSGGSSEVTVTISPTVTLTSTWQRFTVNITVPSITGKTIGTGSHFYFGIGQGGSTSTNAWTLDITGLQLEVGSVATDFEHRSYGEELAKCQRYFYRHADYSNRRTVAASFRTSATDVEGVVTFPSTMRSTPTLISTSGTDYYRDYCLNNGTNLTSVSAHNIYLNNAVLQWSGHSRTAGQAGYMRTNNAGATVDFDAEL